MCFSRPHLYVILIFLYFLFLNSRLLFVVQLGSDADFLELLDELSASMHLEHDVASADELALKENLRYGRPAAVLLDAAANLLVLEHIVRLERHAVYVEYVDDGFAEAALGLNGVALHENNNGVLFDQLIDTL